MQEKADGVRPTEASRRNTRERTKLLDKLVEYGEKIGRLTVENARWKSHVMTIDAELKSVTRVERSERERLFGQLVSQQSVRDIFRVYEFQ